MFSSLKKAAAAAVALTAWAAAPEAHAQELVKIDGSSTVYPITEAVAEEFQAKNKNVRVTVGISGTGGGMKKFVRGEIDISNASRPILPDEVKQAKAAGVEFIELPIAFDALTVVIHPDNTWAKEITVEELKKIWEPGAERKVTKWSDVRPDWPKTPLKLYGAGADSGTFDYFTEAVVGKAKSSRADYTASEDDSVLVQGVSGDRNALGYFGYAYYAASKDKLQAVAVVNAQTGKAVLPSSDTVEHGTYSPLSRPIFIYVNKKSLERPEVRQFVEFYLTEGPDKVEEVKYIPLPGKAYKMGMQSVKTGKTGTVFAEGNAIGISIEEVMERERK